jgi:diguanylate cyclase (GGDEF)-like protein
LGTWFKKDGTTNYVDVAVNAIVYHGEWASLVFLRDISERKETEIQLKHYQEFLETLSTTDGLTGIANRRRFDEVLELEWHRSVRNSTSLSLIMMDIDFFKAFNDHCGHIAGDDCLRKIAMCLDGSLQRATDLTARYGGEEFACILSDTDAEGAMLVANNIRKNVHNLDIRHAYSSVANRITLSMGVATLIPKRTQLPLDLIKQADNLLYEAKNSGRNQIKSLT